jgi:hypothetical protein
VYVVSFGGSLCGVLENFMKRVQRCNNKRDVKILSANLSFY